MSGILQGTKVVDFGRYVAGPYCATLLGFLGAEVIRVEKPGGGEDRTIAPIVESGEGAVFFQTACRKRSMTLNLRSPDSKSVIKRLIQHADVLVANLPPAALARMGLDWDTVHELNPKAILTTQTAFGSTGPWSQRGGFDGVGQAMSGAAFMTGTPGHPVKAAAPYVDYSTAVLSAFGTLAALIQRRQTGLGQHVEGSLMGTAMAVFGSHLIEEAATGIDRQPSGNRVQTSGPSDLFSARDGHVLMHVVGNGLFKRCAQLIGADEWLTDSRFMSDAARGDHRDELCDRVSAWCASRSTDEVLEQCESAGIPAGPVLSLSAAMAHPQASALGLFQQVAWPGQDGKIPVPGLPLTMSGLKPASPLAPPKIGEHTQQVLAEIGFADEDIARLVEMGAV